MPQQLKLEDYIGRKVVITSPQGTIWEDKEYQEIRKRKYVLIEGTNGPFLSTNKGKVLLVPEELEFYREPEVDEEYEALLI